MQGIQIDAESFRQQQKERAAPYAAAFEAVRGDANHALKEVFNRQVASLRTRREHRAQLETDAVSRLARVLELTGEEKRA